MSVQEVSLWLRSVGVGDVYIDKMRVEEIDGHVREARPCASMIHVCVDGVQALVRCAVIVVRCVCVCVGSAGVTLARRDAINPWQGPFVFVAVCCG